MSLSADQLQFLLDRGLSLAEAVEFARLAPTEKPVSKGAERTRRWRENKAARDVTVTSPETRHGDVSHVGECAQVVVLTSSLRSEGTQEANASFVDAPSAKSTPAPPEKPKTKPPKALRGTRLPEDWEPSADEFDLGRQAGLTDEEISRAALEFRNYWCSRSRDATKLSWRLTWHNRVIEIGERKQRTSARMATSPGQSGAGRRGSSTFADLYVQRHGSGSG